MKRIILIFILLHLLFSFALADTISIETAKEVAKNLYYERSVLPYSEFEILDEYFTEKINDIDLIYIFNFEPPGHVMVSSDDRVVPILGYSYEHNYSLENHPPALDWLINDYKHQIKEAIDNDIKANFEIKEKWKKYSADNFTKDKMKSVNNLISTEWGQFGYYNDIVEQNTEWGVPVGCVAVAMAQVMKYWDYPSTGIGSYGYYDPINHDTTGATIPGSDYGWQYADFGATTYNWANMPNEVTSTNTSVATLLYHCGVGVEMDYCINGSGAYLGGIEIIYPYSARAALENYFKYDESAYYYQKFWYSQSSWENMLKGDLDNSCPIIYSGGGHAWVVSGYEYSQFWCNWGWTWHHDDWDGFYSLGDLTPGSYDFNSGQEAVMHIKPLLPKPKIIEISYNDAINAGEYSDIYIESKNIAADSDEGSISISFPSFTTSSDDNHVYPINYSSDGYYNEYPHDYDDGLQIWHINGYLFEPNYLLVEFHENNWTNQETNYLQIRVYPQMSGEFYFYVRSTLGIGEEFVNNLISSSYIDQQGWEVNRYTINVAGSPPDADFVGSPRSGDAPLTVHFTDQSNNNPTSWFWYFGDGGSSSQQNPNHIYQNAGSYTVELTATNQYGSDTETKTNYITVTEPGSPPVADFVGIPRSGNAPLTVKFTDQSTNNPTWWNWSFEASSPGYQQNPNHTYENAGSYTVSLYVSNQYGYDTESKPNYITVTDPSNLDLIIQSPHANPTEIVAGTETTVSCEVKNQGNGSAGSSILKYYLSSDTIYSLSDTELGSDEVGILSSGGTSPENEPLTIPQGTSEGTWYILFYADATNNVDEINEDNNVNYKEITVYPYENLIWPGDTDYSGIANEEDIDPIAVNWGKTGNPRGSISFEWIGSDFPGNWTEPFASLSDCNGDGIVNIADALAICLNWEKTHSVSLKHPVAPDNLEEYRDNFVMIYNSLGDSEIEIKIRNHIAEIFDLPIIEIVKQYNLLQNFPNPFSQTTKISFDLKKDETFSIIKIWNIKGQLVKQIGTENVQYGSNTVVWNGKDQKGNELPNGIYFYQLETNDWKSKIKKMVLMR